LEQVLELELKFYFFEEPDLELDSQFHLCMKLELRFSVWVTQNWPGTGSDFQNQNQGWARKQFLTQYQDWAGMKILKGTYLIPVSIRLGCSKANTRLTLVQTRAK
jgi:hypothetical protein